ncbi:hypothetical protein L6452_19178 [Arctium lappa]|uniref:Uncharacterized protein n=1 Tax=Arctium lappa TaxID=4217 RepID=A0ACB9B8R0_ARCLA|nr:hypothetical protein L6452_19178 [Arctium lappa]
MSRIRDLFSNSTVSQCVVLRFFKPKGISDNRFSLASSASVSPPLATVIKDQVGGQWFKRLVGFFRKQERTAGRERKGWSITVHDLFESSPASMVTPFVASPGSDRVSRSNPDCWLILRLDDGTWKPWGRLEAFYNPNSSPLSSNWVPESMVFPIHIRSRYQKTVRYLYPQ